MEAALFTYRWFDKPDDEFPSSVGAFILFGRSELINDAATRKLDELVAASRKSPARLHSVGPLAIHQLIRTQTAWQEIDWVELARRVEQETAVRPSRDEGGCIFLMPSAKNRVLAQEIDLPPEIAAELQKEFQRALLSEAPNRSDGQCFLFTGSAFRSDCHERIGPVYVIEAPSLTHASAICSELMGGAWKTSVHVEWCCPIHNADLNGVAS